MDENGVIEDKDKFDREEVDLIVSRVRLSALKKISKIIEDQTSNAKEASYFAMLNEGDEQLKRNAQELIYGVKILENVDEQVRNGVHRQISDYLTD